jgi:hypothetical protein
VRFQTEEKGWEDLDRKVIASRSAEFYVTVIGEVQATGSTLGPCDYVASRMSWPGAYAADLVVKRISKVEKAVPESGVHGVGDTVSR